jgi:hypothetical protein
VIQKKGLRFSEKILLKQKKDGAGAGKLRPSTWVASRSSLIASVARIAPIAQPSLKAARIAR